MNTDRDFIYKSTYKNILNFIKDRPLNEIYDLCDYLGGTYMNTPPNEPQKEFIEEFFGHHEWAVYVNDRKSTSLFRRMIPPFDLANIIAILYYETIKLSRKEIEKLNSIDVGKVKTELEDALDNSYEDGVFSKVAGFSNLYEVLVENEFVKERQD